MGYLEDGFEEVEVGRKWRMQDICLKSGSDDWEGLCCNG
jgi:hypothetical protein